MQQLGVSTVETSGMKAEAKLDLVVLLRIGCQRQNELGPVRLRLLHLYVNRHSVEHLVRLSFVFRSDRLMFLVDDEVVVGIRTGALVRLFAQIDRALYAIPAKERSSPVSLVLR